MPIFHYGIIDPIEEMLAIALGHNIGLYKPSCVHIAITLLHTREGVSQRFIDDLKQAVEKVKTTPDTKKGMAPVYGMAATLPARGIVSDILKKYLDTYYKA